jgi:hypothetical protein
MNRPASLVHAQPARPALSSRWHPQLSVRRLFVLLLVAAAATGSGALTPDPALAGTYTVWYCQDSAGRGITGAERDWSRGFSGAGYAPEVIVTCPGDLDQPSGAISTTVEANPNNSPDEVTDDAQMFAPAFVALTHLDLWWNGLVNDGSQVAAIALSGGSVPVGGLYEGQVLADDRSHFGPATPLASPPESHDLPANTTGLLLRSACLQGSGTCQTGTFAQFSAQRVAVVASDASAPQGTATGALVSDPVLVGQQSVTVAATDQGAGVFVVRVLIDGQVRASTPFGDRLCRDIDTSDRDPFEFSTISPCPLHDTATVQLDTTAIGDDAYHHVQVQAVDAAGNATTIAERTVGVSRATLPGFFDPVNRRFLNPWLNLAAPRQLNGQGASAGAILRIYLPVRRTERIRHGRHKGQRRHVVHAAARRTVRYASRPTLRAVLTDAARRPISGAKVWIASRVEGREWQITGRPQTTGRTGRVGLRLPARTPSRQINVVYFPFSDSHEQARGRPVTVNVRAGATLAVSRHRARNGQHVRFRGHVAGPLAPGGVTASLQVRLGRRYRTFRALRVTADGGGKFDTTYRFDSTSRPTRYRFRVLVSRQAGLPYERGTSRATSVVVRP